MCGYVLQKQQPIKQNKTLVKFNGYAKWYLINNPYLAL